MFHHVSMFCCGYPVAPASRLGRCRGLPAAGGRSPGAGLALGEGAKILSTVDGPVWMFLGHVQIRGFSARQRSGTARLFLR